MLDYYIILLKFLLVNPSFFKPAIGCHVTLTNLMKIKKRLSFLIRQGRRGGKLNALDSKPYSLRSSALHLIDENGGN